MFYLYFHGYEIISEIVYVYSGTEIMSKYIVDNKDPRFLLVEQGIINIERRKAKIDLMFHWNQKCNCDFIIVLYIYIYAELYLYRCISIYIKSHKQVYLCINVYICKYIYTRILFGYKYTCIYDYGDKVSINCLNYLNLKIFF